MRVLLDECVPRKLKYDFIDVGHECRTASEAGFSGMENGELLAAAAGSFDAMITVDRNIRYQQNKLNLSIALLVIRSVSNSVEDIRPHLAATLSALKSIQPGDIVEIG